MRCSIYHPGTQHSGNLAAALHEKSMLGEFWTGFRLRNEGTLYRLMNISRHRLLAKVIQQSTRELWLPDLLGIAARATPISGERRMRMRNRIFQKLIPDDAIARTDALIGFDTSSWLLAKRAKSAGKRFILDRTTVHRRTRASIRRRHVPSAMRPVVRNDADVQGELETLELHTADSVVVASEFARASLEANGISGKRVSLIPYGVDLDHFRPPNEVRRGPPVLLFVGNLTMEKGVYVLLDAWRKLTGQRAQLWLAGPLTPAIRREISRVEGVRLLGKLGRERLISAYQRANALVFPTLYDGFGMVLLEALACGLPIISTSCCAAPELLRAGAPGIICEPNDAQSLGDAIAQVVMDPSKWRRTASAARLTCEQYSWNAYAERWVNLLTRTST